MADWRIIENTVARLSYPNLAFVLSSDNDQYQLRVEAPEWPNTVTGQPEWINGRWWRLSKHMTAGEVAQTALKAVLTFYEHEVRELFKVDGVTVFDPHYDLDKLVALRLSNGGGLKEREPALPVETPLRSHRCSACGSSMHMHGGCL